MSQTAEEGNFEEVPQPNWNASQGATAATTGNVPFPKRLGTSICLPDGVLDNRVGKFGHLFKHVKCSILSLYKSQYRSNENYKKYGFLRENEIEAKLQSVDVDGKFEKEITVVFSENVSHCADALANFRFAKANGARDGDKYLSGTFANLEDDKFKAEIGFISSKCREFYEINFANHHYNPEFEDRCLTEYTYVCVIDDGNSYYGKVTDTIKDGDQQLYYQILFDDPKFNDHLKFWHWSHVIPVGKTLEIPKEVEPHGRNKSFFAALAKSYPGEELVLRNGDKCLTEGYMSWRNTMIVFNMTRHEKKLPLSLVQFVFPWDVKSFRGKTFLPPKHELGTERLLYSVSKGKRVKVEFAKSTQSLTASVDVPSLTKDVTDTVETAISNLQKTGTKAPKDSTVENRPKKKGKQVIILPNQQGNNFEIPLDTFSSAIAESLGKITQTICAEMSNSVANSNRETVNRMVMLERHVEGLNVENRNFLHSSIGESKAARQAYEMATNDVKTVRDEMNGIGSLMKESLIQLNKLSKESTVVLNSQREAVTQMQRHPSHSTSIGKDNEIRGESVDTPIDPLFHSGDLESEPPPSPDVISERAQEAAQNRELFAGEDIPGAGIKEKMQFLVNLGRAVNKDGTKQQCNVPSDTLKILDKSIVNWDLIESSLKVKRDSFVDTDFGNVHLSDSQAFVAPIHLADMPFCVKARMIAKLAVPEDDLKDTAAVSSAAKDAALLFVGTLLEEMQQERTVHPKEVHFNGKLTSCIVKKKGRSDEADLSLINNNPEPISSMLSFIRSELIGAPQSSLNRALSNAMVAVLGRIRKETFKVQAQKSVDGEKEQSKKKTDDSDSNYQQSNESSDTSNSDVSNGKRKKASGGVKSMKSPAKKRSRKTLPVPPNWTKAEAEKIINEGFGSGCPKVFERETILSYASEVVQASWFLENHKDKWLEAGIGLFMAMFFDVKGRLSEKFARKIGYTLEELANLKDEDE